MRTPKTHPSTILLFFLGRCRGSGFTHEIVTRQTYEDFVWMVYGVVGIACTYLEEDGGLILYQGQSSSDVCKHFFTMIRNSNPIPTLQQCCQLASKCAHFIKSNLFSFKGRQNPGKAPVGRSDYLQLLYKRPKKK